MNNGLLARFSVALVWLYQGLWCKLLGRAPQHERVVEGVPFLSSSQAHDALLVLGALECGLAIWVIWGRWGYPSAWAQTILLCGMNLAAIVWSGGLLPDPAGMLFQNFAFLVLAWIAAGELKLYAQRY